MYIYPKHTPSSIFTPSILHTYPDTIMTSHHQDWEVVTLNKRPAPTTYKTTHKPPPQTVTSTSFKPAWKVEQQVDADTGKPITRVGTQTGKAITQARVNAKLTQAQLAVRLNMQEKYIKDVEAGTAIENKAHLAKIRRALNMS